MKLEKELFIVPEVYTRSKTLFWEDTYISKKLLATHLDTNCEGASRSYSFIETSVAWISEIVPKKEYPYMLDLGCGPGLYSEKLCRLGYQVTGMDISKRSIAYAIEVAEKGNLEIFYHCVDYLQVELENSYDAVIMIFCDYGALSKVEREKILQKVYHGLRDGGVFLLDVFTNKVYDSFVEKQTWEYIEKDGFWLPQEHVTLQRNIKYPDLITLEQTIVMTEDTTQNYYIWNTYFTKEALLKEVQSVGFKVEGIYGNVAGEEYQENSETICVMLRK